MKRTNRPLMLLAALLLAPAVHAADEVHRLPVSELMQSPEAAQLDGSIRLYWAGQKAPRVLENKGEFISNKKTNAFAKSAAPTCHRAAASALLSLQERARQAGANAVTNIVSYYKKVPVASDSEYECHVGALMTGVAFKGTMVRVPN